MRGREPGLDRLLETMRAVMCWSMLNPGLASLLFWRPVPRFEPSPESYALGLPLVEGPRADLADAVRRGQLVAHADSDEVMRLLITIPAGVCTAQLANEPHATYETGRFTSLAEDALNMFVQTYATTTEKERR